VFLNNLAMVLVSLPINIERKGPLMNKLERFHIHSISKENLQMNDTYNPIFNLITNYYKIPYQPSPSLHQPPVP
jgi:hypothetical protein